MSAVGDCRRVCMVVHAAYPLAETRVEREARVALERGFEVTVVCLWRPGEAATELVDGVRVIRIPLQRTRDRRSGAIVGEYFGFALRVAKTVGSLKLRRGDVLHLHNPPDFFVLTAAIAKVTGVRVIYDVHDLAPELFVQTFGSGLFATLAVKVLKATERLNYRLADRVLTVHEPYANELVSRGAKRAKVTSIMNSLDESLIADSAPPREPRSTQLVVYHGTLSRRYGLDLLLAAVAQSRLRGSFRVEIYGEGPETDALLALRERLGLGEVSITGTYLPQAEVLTRVREADLGVICSRPPVGHRHLGLPTKLLEYVALGVPVVVSDLETIRAHFTDEHARFFSPGHPESLACALDDVLEDPEGATRRANAALRHYTQLYAWPIQAKKYADTLSSLSPMSRSA